MSVNIDTALIKGFEVGVTLLAQQEGSRLRDGVDVRMVGPGEEFSFDQLGEADPDELTVRHAPTPIGDIGHYRRWATPKTFARGEYIDKPDALKTINSFANPYTRALGMGFGRQQDRELIAAATGTARTGKTSATSSEAFPSATHQIAHGSQGLTLEKITQAAYLLQAYEMPKPWYLAVSAMQIRDVMRDSTITSADYNTVKLLMTGEVDQFMGFTWKTTQLLAVASSIRSCLAWSKPCLLLAVEEQPEARIGEDMTRNYLTQVYYRAMFGATRMQQYGVVEILCSEA